MQKYINYRVAAVHYILDVLDPGKGVCADPVNRAPSWREGDRVPQAGTKSVS
jgi:hypothetical protein